jgi:transcriptional regulator GlxA family with amidase domain
MASRSAALGIAAAGSLALRNKALASLVAAGAPNDAAEGSAAAKPLTSPAHGSIDVAFLISEGAVMIDFTGPWEVFQDVFLPSRSAAPFRLYTVAETAKPIHASGGMKIVPDCTIANAPAPKVIVIPAQSAASEKTKEWIRRSAKSADVTMSVCTGAFVLASTGLLSGKAATTHHGSYADLEKRFPDIQVKRGDPTIQVSKKQYVDQGIITSAGISAGIDMALYVVGELLGPEVSADTARYIEY